MAENVHGFGQAVGGKGGLHGIQMLVLYLQHRAQLFVKQGAHGRVVQFGAAAAAVGLFNQIGNVDMGAQMAGKQHFGQGGNQAAIAAVVVGKQSAFIHQGLHGIEKALQVCGLV